MNSLHSNKKQKKRRSKRRRRPINVLASVLTTFSLYCGISSVFASINGEYTTASYWILSAIILDMLDGAVARLTNSVSEFGKELDSLGDIVSFGVGPSVLMYTAYIQAEPAGETLIDPTGSMLAIVFVICGALRLARYNVYQSTRRDYFVGLPIPAAAGALASFVLFTEDLGWESVPVWVFGPVILLLSVLMVSAVLYPKDRLKAFVLRPRHAFQFLVLCVIGIAVFDRAVQYSPAIVLLPLAAAYVFFGLTNDLYARGKRILNRNKAAETDSSLGQEPHSKAHNKTRVAK